MAQIPESRRTPPSHTSQANPTAQERPSLSVEWWPIERPIPYARNPEGYQNPISHLTSGSLGC
jgi:hypothetical protein